MASDVKFRKAEIDLDGLPKVDRADAWRTLAASCFEVSGLPADLHGVGRLVQLGSVGVTLSDHPQQVFRRTKERARRDGVDHIMCSVELSAGGQATAEDRDVPLGERRATFWDLSRASMKASAPGRTLCLTIARDDLARLLPTTDGLHGLTLEADSLAADYLMLLAKRLSDATLQSARHLERASLEMLAACLQPSLQASECVPSAAGDVLLARAERRIDARLADPDFGPEQLAAAIGVSRTRLYQLFEPLGGVSGYIRDRRLDTARRLIASMPEGGRLYEIASATGFKSDSQFSRAFRRRFGVAPGDAREGLGEPGALIDRFMPAE